MGHVLIDRRTYDSGRLRAVDRLRRFFGWAPAADPPLLPAARPPGPRRPVEHGPTKAPFSRVHRRRMRLIANASRARNR